MNQKHVKNSWEFQKSVKYYENNKKWTQNKRRNSSNSTIREKQVKQEQKPKKNGKALQYKGVEIFPIPKTEPFSL